MPKKSWTEEERKAFGIKMKAAREKKNEKTIPESNAPTDAPVEEPVSPTVAPDTIAEDDLAELRRQIQELKDMQWAQTQNQAQESRVALQGGRLIGTVEKYDLSPEIYPNPTERLAKEPRLARFAFNDNYILSFDVAVTEYTTIDGIRTKEPKFTLVLAAYLYDEETGERKTEEDGSPSAYVVRRLIMHEDPEAALAIAREQNLEVDEANEVAFLNEMRYIRMRDFLLECYFPTRPQQNNRKKEIVVGGKVVETFQVIVEGEDKVKLDYDQVKNHKL